MRIAVVLNGINPTEGGGFTFVHDVAEAFLDQASGSRHEFILLCPTGLRSEISRRELPANLRLASLPSPTRLDRATIALRHAGLGMFGLDRLGAIERRLRRLGAQFAWFVGGPADTLETPYLATVWDVQHRTHPWFPEVSAGGRWDYREAILRRHLKRATYVITGTSIGADQLTRFFGISAERIKTLPHPTPRFALRAPQVSAVPGGSPSVTEPYFLYPAQFCRWTCHGFVPCP
jgi:hypothetical protein